jgi:NifU-like protein
METQKVNEAALNPRHRGAIFQMEADDKGLALIDQKVKSLKIYALVDPDSDTVLDTKFFTYGGPVYTAVADAVCEQMMGLPVEAIAQMDVPKIFEELELPKDAPECVDVEALLQGFAPEYPEKKQLAFAARAAMGSAKIKAFTAEGRAQADAEWEALSDEERKNQIEEALDEFVRPMLMGDGGGMEIMGLKDHKRLLVRYSGACAGCGAAGGATLYFIEDQLRQNVYYALSVEPDFSGMEELTALRSTPRNPFS